jgi:mono/diheme cytochrome c family protein
MSKTISPACLMRVVAIMFFATPEIARAAGDPVRGKQLAAQCFACHGVDGIHGVTSTVLTDDDARMVSISETGNRVMQYDLANDRQLPDLANFGEMQDAPPMVLVMSQMSDGEIVARNTIGENNSLSGIAQYPGNE